MCQVLAGGGVDRFTIDPFGRMKAYGGMLDGQADTSIMGA